MADRGFFPSVAVDEEEEGAVDGEVGIEDAPDDVAVVEEEEGEVDEEEDGEDAGLVLILWMLHLPLLSTLQWK